MRHYGHILNTSDYFRLFPLKIALRVDERGKQTNSDKRGGEKRSEKCVPSVLLHKKRKWNARVGCS
jgi:hypothetical protein